MERTRGCGGKKESMRERERERESKKGETIMGGKTFLP